MATQAELLAALQQQFQTAGVTSDAQTGQAKDELDDWLTKRLAGISSDYAAQNVLATQLMQQQRDAASGVSSAERQSFGLYGQDLARKEQADLRSIASSMAQRGFGDSTLAVQQQANLYGQNQSIMANLASQMAQREAERNLGISQSAGQQQMALMQAQQAATGQVQDFAGQRGFGLGDIARQQQSVLGAEQRGLTKDLYTNAWNKALTEAGWQQQEKMQLGSQQFTAGENLLGRTFTGEQNELSRAFDLQQAMDTRMYNTNIMQKQRNWDVEDVTKQQEWAEWMAEQERKRANELSFENIIKMIPDIRIGL